MKNGEKYILMSFGDGGNSGYILSPDGSSCTSSWYARPEDLQRYIDDGHYPPEKMEGCLLLNKRALLEKRPSLAITSPMCDAKLKDGEENRFNHADLESPFAQAVVKNFAQTGGLGAALAFGTARGMDIISCPAYYRHWVELGAIGGVVKGGKVVWIVD